MGGGNQSVFILGALLVGQGDIPGQGTAAIALLIGRLMVAGTPGLALTASLVTAMRNPGLALLFAGRHGEQLVGVKPAILMDVLVTLVVSLPLMRRGRQLEP